MMGNIIGQKFGKLMVIERTEERYTDGSILYLCRCDCGKFVKLTSSRLKSGHNKTCGDPIHQVKNLMGKKFGRLMVVDYVGRKNRKTLWSCKCDCGNTTIADSNSLKDGAIVSCGCRRFEGIAMGQKILRSSDVDGTNLRFIGSDRKINCNNKTGIRGVSWSKDKLKFHAQITFKRKAYHLGYFNTLEEATKARKQAEKDLYGKFLDEHKEKA